jgi:hypothetical protein
VVFGAFGAFEKIQQANYGSIVVMPWNVNERRRTIRGHRWDLVEFVTLHQPLNVSGIVYLTNTDNDLAKFA